MHGSDTLFIANGLQQGIDQLKEIVTGNASDSSQKTNPAIGIV